MVVMVWICDVLDLALVWRWFGTGLSLAFQERGVRFSFQLVPTVSKNSVNERKSVAWVLFSAFSCTHAIKVGRKEINRQKMLSLPP